jgi:hypothetical protein
MPVHDWTRVDAGIVQHFHLNWIGELARVLNRGLLPLDHYALAEQGNGIGEPVRYRARPEAELYATRARTVAVRHASRHQLLAVIELVSPGNKSGPQGLRAFVEKADVLLASGVQLLIVDLFPPGPHDPQGIHKAVWDQITGGGASDFSLAPDRRLTVAAYTAGPSVEAYVEPVACGAALPDMPLFVAPDVYINVPLEATYQSAWEAVPAFWRDVLTAPPNA